MKINDNQAVVYNPRSENEEGWFSWLPCDVCNSPLGGMRYPVAIIEPGKGCIDDDLCCCGDCLEKL